jgi:cyclophilin family peptidyl-prolyl cis-trans isomerase
VGTDKRERQKANRALKNQELAKQYRNERRKKTAVRTVGVVVLALAAVVGIAWAGGAFSDDDEATSPTTLPFDDLSSIPLDSIPLDTVPVQSTTPLPETTAPVTVAGASVTGETPCPAADGSSPRTITFEQAPPMCIDEAATYTALISTNKGDLTVELDAAAAPITVNNFVVLARYHYFDNTQCHRIIPGFVAQCGDPTATGAGGPGYEFDDELPEAGQYEVGSLAMANSGPNTNGSQFFVITGAQGAALPPSYSLFGTVTDGLDTTVAALDAAGNSSGDGVPPLEQVIITSVTITES